jgi:hypothetical protein
VNCQTEIQFILLSPCAFLAEIDILLPKLAVEMGAEDCIFLHLKTFKISFILMDVVCVLAQLAGTARKLVLVGACCESKLTSDKSLLLLET